MSDPADDDGRCQPVGRARPKKAPNAFRTISEVADELHIPQHVLRFWETKFPQVKPLKRGGGRRYYRPDDIALLRRISDLLYTQGYTIKGVQRLLREGGLAEGEQELPLAEPDRPPAASRRCWRSWRNWPRNCTRWPGGSAARRETAPDTGQSPKPCRPATT